MDDNFPRRRIIGVLIGAWIGLVYTLFNYGINPIFIRDLPIYFDFTGFLQSLLIYFTAGAILGLAVNSPHEALPAVVLSSFAAGIAIFIGSFTKAMGNGDAVAFVFLIMFYSFMPLMVMIMPLTTLLRWSAGRLQHVYGSEWRRWRNWGLIVAVTLLGGLIGSSSLYAGESRQMLYRMNDLIIRVQQSGENKVPDEFLPIVSTIQNSSPEFRLRWTDNVKEFPVPIFFEDSYANFRMQVVLAYFDSGEVVGCLFRVFDAGVYWCAAQ